MGLKLSNEEMVDCFNTYEDSKTRGMFVAAVMLKHQYMTEDIAVLIWEAFDVASDLGGT